MDECVDVVKGRPCVCVWVWLKVGRVCVGGGCGER